MQATATSFFNTRIFRKHELKLFSLLVHILATLLLLSFTKSVYTLTEDFYIAYWLGNGFGNGHSAFLHYNHVVHPFLAIPLKGLFTLNPGINWYSLLLVVAHVLAGSVIFYCLLLRQGTTPATIVYGVLWLVFETNSLLHINFNNSALILYIAAIVLLLNTFMETYVNRFSLLLVFLLVLLGSFFRIHVFLIPLGVSLPFFFLAPVRRYWRYAMAILILTVGGIWLQNRFHQYYYSSHITNWKQEELGRQQVYRLSNFGTQFSMDKLSNEQKLVVSFVASGMLMDSALLGNTNVTKFLQSDGVKKRNNFFQSLTGIKKYVSNPWFWINNRLYFLSFIVIAFLVHYYNRWWWVVGSMSLLLLMLGSMSLIVYARLMDYVYIYGLYLILLLLLLFTRLGISLPYAVRRGCYFLLLTTAVAAVIHIFHSSRRNQDGIAHFNQCYRSVTAHPDTLFIITSYDFPLQTFNAFAAPASFPLRNFISNEDFINRTQGEALRRFGIEKINELPYRKNILFWGPGHLYLQQYFQIVTGKPVRVSEPQPGYPESVVRQFTID
jgi:hypothetical protein